MEKKEMVSYTVCYTVYECVMMFGRGTKIGYGILTISVPASETTWAWGRRNAISIALRREVKDEYHGKDIIIEHKAYSQI